MGQHSSRSDNSNGEFSERNLEIDQTLKFPFLLDEETIMHMKCSQAMIILRGLPGSGKSFLAHQLKDIFGKGCQICSIDDYFSQGTHYRFDPAKMTDAIVYCQEMAAEACANGKHVVVIDNFNLSLVDMSYFTRLAHQTNYVLLVEEPRTPWKFNVVVLASKNRRNLGEDEINERFDFWEEIIPIYFGWFLNVNDSLALVSIAEAYLDKCTADIPEFVQQFKEVMTFEGQDDIHDYFSLPSNQPMLHCTTHFCKDRNIKDEYMMLESVQNAYGSKTSLSVVGFVVTPQTFLARVKLTSQQLTIWGQDDYEQSVIQDGVDIVSNSNTATGFYGTGRPSGPPGEPVCITTLRPYANPEKRTSQYFQPIEGLGRRAHITLGCAKGVKPVQSGFDLIEAVELENFSQKANVPTFDIGCANVRKYGDATWVIYPNKIYVIDALFAFFMSERK